MAFFSIAKFDNCFIVKEQNNYFNIFLTGGHCNLFVTGLKNNHQYFPFQIPKKNYKVTPVRNNSKKIINKIPII